MPVYEYRCGACGHVFDVTHEVGGRSGPCPVCGGAPRRIFTSVGLIFKGAGFHTTDYRRAASESGPNRDAKDGAAAEGGGTKDGTAKQGGAAAGGGGGPAASGSGTEASSKES